MRCFEINVYFVPLLHSRATNEIEDEESDETYEKYGLYGPWIPSIVKSETLEREFISYLLSHDAELLELGGSQVFVALPEISVISLKDGLLPSRTAKELSAQLEYLSRLDGDWVRAFIIGAIVHWVVLVVYKHEGGEIEVCV
jgi:hypothetical protein